MQTVPADAERNRRKPALFFVVFALIWASLAPLAAAEKSGPVIRITEEQAGQAALKVLPGRITDVSIEKKRGKTVYVVEIVADKDSAETDVLVDIESGKVLGIDK